MQAIVDALNQCIFYHRIKAEEIQTHLNRMPDNMPNAKTIMVNMIVAHRLVISGIENCIHDCLLSEDMK